MKYRKGFITNSSSSSFIGVFAKIKNINKAKGVIEKYNLQDDVYNKKFLNIKDNYDFSKDWCSVDLLQGKTIDEIKKNAKWNDLFLEWYSLNDWYNDENYDCDIGDFCDTEIEIYNAISEENGFEIIGADYGAGYNG